MNIKEGIDNIKRLTEKVPEGPQRDYFLDIIRRMENGEAVNPSEFIKGMENENFKGVDIEGLKQKEAAANKIFQQWVKR